MKANEPSPAVADASGLTIFLPLALLGIGLLLFLGLQVKNEAARQGGLRQAISQREPVIAQGKQVREKLDKLASDLVALSRTDAEARAIVAKFRIQVVNPAPTP